jgi:hypothetical protein
VDEKNLVWLAGGRVEESRLMLRFFGDDLDPSWLSATDQRLNVHEQITDRENKT